MKILILGGTAFVGRALTELALERGHEVTLFNRGKTAPDIFSDAEHLVGDRTEGDLDALKGREWDAVIDTTGYVPRVVGETTRLLKDAVGLYTFISTISVYAEFTPGLNEDSALATLEDETAEEITGETYGGLKVLCEQVVQRDFPDNSLIIRPGLIVGPWDYTHRFAYWIQRVAEGGEMIAPGDPHQPMQIIDARDLAAFTLNMTEAGTNGIFNATGPAEPLPLRTILGTISDVTQADTTMTWVDEAFLVQNEVESWTALPLWVPAENSGIHKVDVSRAIANGLTFRPLAETVRDSWAWLQEQAQQPDSSPQVARGSMSREREAELLAKWHAR